MNGLIQGSPAITDFLETFSFSKKTTTHQLCNADFCDKSSKIIIVGDEFWIININMININIAII